MINKNKMRIAILKQLKNNIISTYDLANSQKLRTKAKKEAFVKEINHLYSTDLIIPVYCEGVQHLMTK